jgi:hypothetical protein
MKDTASNRSEFRICIQAMFTCLGGEFSDAALLGYWIALNDMELQQVQQACHNAMRTSKFVPKPVELREAVFGRTDDRAMLAWGDVQRAIPLGSYKHVDFEDKIINASIRNLGGWPAFMSRLTDSEAEKWTRIEFLKCYTNLYSSGVSGDMCEPLPGLSQMEASQGVLQAPVPRKVGCTNTTQPRIRQVNVRLLEAK